MSCFCDEHHCPTPLAIAAGLACLPRAPGTFADWRESLLAAVGHEPALDSWRMGEPGALGMMLLEMGAYVLDVASFYDQLVANESYLGTARLTGTQRRHVSLLGYRPRPAVASSVWLAALADGTRLLTLPSGTAIRSGEFDGNPPQVFELGDNAAVEPRVNQLEVARVRHTLLPSPLSSLPVRTGSVRVRPGEVVVLVSGNTLAATRIASSSPLVLVRLRDDVTRLRFSPAVTPPAGATYAASRLLRPGSTCGVWRLTPAEPPLTSSTELSLDTRLRIHVGDIVAVSHGSSVAARRVVAVNEPQYTVLPALQSTLTDADDNVTTLLSPAIKAGTTRITLDGPLPFSASTAAQWTVHHTMVEAATLVAPWKDTLAQGDPIGVPGLVDAPRVPRTELLLEDVHGEGVATTGMLASDTRSASTDAAPAWGRELWPPVQLFGNVFLATRGESVRGEVLGAGDASRPMQHFRLKKKPLTYLSAANASGRDSTLVVHVGGVRWKEVESFFGVGADERVYTVTHDDAGEADLHFGGGARLPTGAAVIADYRFGAGAAVPPADSVKQLARPVAGLRKLRNVLPAFGGADAEGPAELALRGPRSALLLGRAISLVDIETAAAQQPGVRAARAQWRWDEAGLRPAVVVSYIGDAQLAPQLQAALRALAEHDAPITAASASGQPVRLDVDLEIDPDRVPDDVIAAVSAVFFGPVTLPGTGGLLRPERLGPDGVLFQSVVVHAVMDVPGVAALRALRLDRHPFDAVGRQPAAGRFFDFETGGVWVNGRLAS